VRLLDQVFPPSRLLVVSRLEWARSVFVFGRFFRFVARAFEGFARLFGGLLGALYGRVGGIVDLLAGLLDRTISGLFVTAASNERESGNQGSKE
jgi:hypothetical protein